MLRLFQTVSSKKQHVPLSVISSTYRNHNFQTKIYTDKFTSKQIPEAELKSDLENFKSKRNLQPNLYRFIKAYHQNGHKLGDINPLSTNEAAEHSELTPEYYDLQRDAAVYATQGLLNSQSSSMTLTEIESYLKNTYSDKMTVEFDFLSTISGMGLGIVPISSTEAILKPSKKSKAINPYDWHHIFSEEYKEGNLVVFKQPYFFKID